MDEDNDFVLLLKIREGDKTAFETLARRKDTYLYNFALRFLHDESLAKDIVCETFEKLRQNCNRIRDPNKLNAWLKAVARNGIYNLLVKRRREISTDDITLAHYIDTRYSTNDNIVEKIFIRDCLNALPEPQLLTLMYYHDGFTLAQISRMTGKSVMQVRTLLKNAGRNFMKMYNKG